MLASSKSQFITESQLTSIHSPAKQKFHVSCSGISPITADSSSPAKTRINLNSNSQKILSSFWNFTSQVPTICTTVKALIFQAHTDCHAQLSTQNGLCSLKFQSPFTNLPKTRSGVSSNISHYLGTKFCLRISIAVIKFRPPAQGWHQTMGWALTSIRKKMPTAEFYRGIFTTGIPLCEMTLVCVKLI